MSFQQLKTFLEAIDLPKVLDQTSKLVLHCGIKDFDKEIRVLRRRQDSKIATFEDCFKYHKKLDFAGYWFKERHHENGISKSMKKAEKTCEYLSVTVFDCKKVFKEHNVDEKDLERVTSFKITRLSLLERPDCHVFIDSCKFEKMKIHYVTLSIQLNSKNESNMKIILQEFGHLLIVPVRSKILEYLHLIGKLENSKQIGTEWFSHRMNDPLTTLIPNPTPQQFQDWINKTPLAGSLKNRVSFDSDPYELDYNKILEKVEGEEQLARALYYLLHSWELAENLPNLYAKNFQTSDFCDQEFIEFIQKKLEEDFENFSLNLKLLDLKKILEFCDIFPKIDQEKWTQLRERCDVLLKYQKAFMFRQYAK